MREDFTDRVKRAAQSILDRTDFRPKVGVVLGSGLSGIVSRLMTGSVDATQIPYGDIDGFRVPSVVGHQGSLSIFRNAAVMAGRFHFYEGIDLDDVVLPTATLAALGVTALIVTNAAGGINPDFAPGDLVLIRDHINLMGTNPLIGPVDPESGVRFPDMTVPYDSTLGALARQSDPDLKEGVYVALTGPSYETPAEIAMLRAIGADLVGMSTVPEVIVARAYGVRVVGISTVTNAAAGMSGKPLDHDEVVEIGKSIEGRMAKLVASLIQSIPVEP